MLVRGREGEVDQVRAVVKIDLKAWFPQETTGAARRRVYRFDIVRQCTVIAVNEQSGYR